MPNRGDHLASLRAKDYDVLILGGGINGAGVARDLALRANTTGTPLRIALIEKNHFASGTSGKNSQLIHGGLRYLKYFEFHLVREALRERATLLRIAPHLVAPQPFLIPLYEPFAKAFYGAGLTLYDALAGSRNVARHRAISAAELHRMEPAMEPRRLRGAQLFFDCQVNSARLVLDNIFDAARLGATVVNYVEAVDVSPTLVRARDTLTGDRFEINARQVVDSTGAWAASDSLRLVRGSHLILPRLNHSDNAIAHFDPQGRVVFLIPWGSRRQLTLVGTTDVDHNASPDQVQISAEETEYLTNVVRRLYPNADTTPISTYSSLRPLIKTSAPSATSTSREHRIWRAESGIVHIAGGKYTTYRSMSEEATDLVCRDLFPALTGQCTTATTVISGRPDLPSPAEAAQYEMAQTAHDYLYVSTYLGYESRTIPDALAQQLEEIFPAKQSAPR